MGRVAAGVGLVLRDEYAAQDAVQEACIEAWRSLPGLREPDAFEGWLCRLLMRACFRHIRNNRGTNAPESQLTPTDEPTTLGHERQLDIHDQLERGLARLAPELRAVV